MAMRSWQERIKDGEIMHTVGKTKQSLNDWLNP